MFNKFINWLYALEPATFQFMLLLFYIAIVLVISFLFPGSWI